MPNNSGLMTSAGLSTPAILVDMSAPAGSLALNASGTATFTTVVSVGNATPAATGVGITFPAAQSASSDANTLDDYREGTFTSVVRDAAAGNAATCTASGRYTRIGRLVSTFVREH